MNNFGLICNPGIEDPELLLDYLKRDNIVYIDSLPYRGVNLYAKNKVRKIEKVKTRILKRVNRSNFK